MKHREFVGKVDGVAFGLPLGGLLISLSQKADEALRVELSKRIASTSPFREGADDIHVVEEMLIAISKNIIARAADEAGIESAAKALRNVGRENIRAILPEAKRECASVATLRSKFKLDDLPFEWSWTGCRDVERRVGAALEAIEALDQAKASHGRIPANHISTASAMLGGSVREEDLPTVLDELDRALAAQASQAA